MSARVAPSAIVEDGVTMGDGCAVWHRAHVRSGAVIGAECIIGSGAFIDAGVTLGSRCKVQNLALVYSPARLGDGVFIGPGAILTNDKHPRAVTPDGGLKSAEDWEAVGVDIADGASVGAGAICIAPLKVGRWAMIASGAVVTSDVPDYALMVGTPARRVGWVGPAGARLVSEDGTTFRCSESGRRFREVASDQLVEVA